MCLDRVDTPETTGKFLKKQSDTITVYKTVKYIKGILQTADYHYLIRTVNTSEKRRKHKIVARNGVRYVPHFHCFVDKLAAKAWCWPGEETMAFAVNKKDITATGNLLQYYCIVAKKITMA